MAGRGFFTNKSGKTGTVPKVKYRNNSSQHQLENNQLSNNLIDGDFHHFDLNYSGNSQRNRQVSSSSSYLLPRSSADTSYADNYSSVSRSNGPSSLNMAGNPYHSTPSTSGTNSRRNSTSTVPKCDNVSKYPDKKQIEDKLEQIREYLRVTSTLMMSIRHGDDRLGYDQADTESLSQMIKDLKDSEAKLILILSQETEIDDTSGAPNLEDNHNCNDNINATVSEHMHRFTRLVEILACQQNKINNICKTNKGEDNRKGDTNIENLSCNNTNSLQRKELEQNVEQSNRNLQILREQQNTLLMLQQKAENQLRDARDAQERLLACQAVQEQVAANHLGNLKTDHDLLLAQTTNSIQSIPEQLLNITLSADAAQTSSSAAAAAAKNATPEERLMLFAAGGGGTSQEVEADVERLQERISALHESAADNKLPLLHLLDNRNAQLSSEHLMLQGKLHELQSKKSQIDQLAAQLQHMNDDSQDEGGQAASQDVAMQVRNIVCMKEQLAKLKDMLEAVKATERNLESQNYNDEFQGADEHAAALNVCTNSNKTDNIVQGMVVKRRSNERWVGNEKQSNKTSASISRERQQLLLQAELQAKKQELEELMYKDQDRTSNINQDVCSEVSINKSEPAGGSGIFDSVPSSWFMVSPQRNRASSRENAYSSDEAPEEDLDYSHHQLNTSLPRTNGLQHNYALPAYPNAFRPSSEASNAMRQSDVEPHRGGGGGGGEAKPRVEFPRTQSTQYIANLQSAATPSRSTRSTSIPTPTATQDANANANNLTEQTNIQKQLELITTLCQSMIEQQSVLQTCGNNLTPSPLYSEPRPSYTSPSAHPMNTLNVVNQGGVSEMPWMAQSMPQQPWFAGAQPAVENAAYPNFLVANTLQTQALMLSTLNQCCQMLWHQQREMSILRSTIQLMQDRLPNYEANVHTLSPYSNMTNYLNPPVVTLSSTPSNQSTQMRPQNQPIKLNPQHHNASTSGPQMSLSHNLNDSQTTNNDSSGFCFPSAATNLNNSNLVLNHQNMTGDPVLHLTTNASNSSVFDNGQSNLNRTIPSQAVWGGAPALNNQVPPGNRANNYWDNFRSYSRQNLLSTSAKRNEMPQNALQSMERSMNNSLERASGGPMSLAQSGPKLNTAHHDPQDSNTSGPSSSRRAHHFEHSVNRNASDAAGTASASSAAHSNKTNENLDNSVMSLHSLNNYLINSSENDIEDSQNNSLPNLALLHHHGEASNVAIADDAMYKTQSSSRRNHNEWNNEEILTDTLPIKSKLFEVLREPIYKEVASLISANVNRPHFLIQLFRDLQMISSDPLRNSTLQSIQSVITNSLSSTPEGNSQGASSSRQSSGLQQQVQNEQEFLPDTSSAETAANNVAVEQVPDNLFAAASSEVSNMENNENDFHLSVNVQQILVQVLSFLKAHKDDIFQISIIDDIKAIILKLVPGVDVLSHANLKQYTGFIVNQLDKILTETLVKYQGKRVHEVKEDVLKEMADILLGELTFLKLISAIDQSNIAEALKSREPAHSSSATENKLPAAASGGNAAAAKGGFMNLAVPTVDGLEEGAIANEMVNGDLAEADQSQLENEEGAIGGGFLSCGGAADNTTENIVVTDETDLPKIEFPVNNTEWENELAEQGLDQVPTRLIKRGGRSLRSASHSPTKRRDRSQSHSDTADHY